MQKKELQKAVISQDELDNAENRLDKYRLILVEPELRHYLNDRDMQYLEKLEVAFALVYDACDVYKAMRMIQGQVAGVETMAYAKQIIRDMGYVYDDFMRRNKVLEQNLYIERQRRLAEKATTMAMTSQDFDYVSKIEERAAKAGGWNKPVEEIEEEEDQPKLLIITSGSKVFEKTKVGKVAELADIIEDKEDEDGV